MSNSQFIMEIFVNFINMNNVFIIIPQKILYTTLKKSIIFLII